MMENADSEDNNTGKRDCDTVTEQANKDKDNDLVKIVLHYPGPKIDGASLELNHEGIAVDASVKGSEMENPEAAIEVLDTGSRLNFYDKDGNKLNPLTDLKITDLKNPGSSYLAKILDPANEGKLTLFIEGAHLFGFQGSQDGRLPRGERDNVESVEAAMEKLGGARIKFVFKSVGQKVEVPLLVYRGGFLVFKQPVNDPGIAGNFEFWDGKGRVRNESGGYQKEFEKDDTDWGNIVAVWSAKSGKMKPTGKLDYRKSDGKGHTPLGWWWAVDNSPLYAEESQLNRKWVSKVSGGEKWQQAGFCRWKLDDEIDLEKRYTTKWVFDASKPKDKVIGKPIYIEYKFRLFPIPPSTRYERSLLLIHPDGKKDGTLGCIGIQSYEECRDIAKTLRAYNGLKIKVQN